MSETKKQRERINQRITRREKIIVLSFNQIELIKYLSRFFIKKIFVYHFCFDLTYQNVSMNITSRLART